MSIRIGIYDFFSYTIPGALMIVIILGSLETMGAHDLWSKINSFNMLQIILSVIGCYLSGFVFSPFLSKWSSLFEPKDFIADALSQIKKRNPNISTDINPVDWPIWLASIRIERLDLAFEIERLLAISIMLRGVSVFLLFSGILIILNVLNTRLSPWYLCLSLFSLCLSIVAAKENIKYKRWFYLSIFETVISRQKPFNFQATPSSNISETNPDN